jgi:hypothetical protein
LLRYQVTRLVVHNCIQIFGITYLGIIYLLKCVKDCLVDGVEILPEKTHTHRNGGKSLTDHAQQFIKMTTENVGRWW